MQRNWKSAEQEKFQTMVVTQVLLCWVTFVCFVQFSDLTFCSSTRLNIKKRNEICLQSQWSRKEMKLIIDELLKKCLKNQSKQVVNEPRNLWVVQIMSMTRKTTINLGYNWCKKKTCYLGEIYYLQTCDGSKKASSPNNNPLSREDSGGGEL